MINWRRKRSLVIVLVLAMIAGLVSPKQTVYAEEEIKTRTVYLSDLEWESATKGCDDK